jgi:hypothetical protein
MKRTDYKTVDDVFNSARVIRDKLRDLGNEPAAKDLTEVINGFWTTASEALTEIVTVLSKVERPWYELVVDGDRLLIEDTIKGARELLNLK